MFYSGRIRPLVAMTTYILHRLIMEKVKIDIFLSKWGYFRIFLLSIALRFIWLLSKSLGNKKGKEKNIYFSETIRWMKLILFMLAYDITLYINVFLFRSGKNY